MKKIITALITIISIINTHSQSQDIAFPHVVPMSPNASELAKYADYPVSYYTGTPNINIPLYEIDLDGFKLPINLSYHASGIRTDQEATWVGLGWSLNVGSRISRSVNCVDDFLIYPDPNRISIGQGYYDAPEQSSIFQTYYDPPINNAWQAGSDYRLLYDTEPDLFYYNLPGINGKFIIDKSRGAVLFDKSHNLKIEVIKNNIIFQNSVTFKLTDSEGNQYFYNKWETGKNYNKNGILNKNIHQSNTIYDTTELSYVGWSRENGERLTSYENPAAIVTSWCVTKIITKNNREINFTYETETQNLPVYESCENYLRNHSSYLYYYKSKQVNEALRLKKIEGDFGRIEFSTSSRIDINGTSEKLDAVSVFNSTNTLIKCYKFDYSYFNNDYSVNPLYTHVFKRLKLNKLTEYTVTNPSLSGYNTAYYANIPLNSGYNFEYYQGDFPPKNTKNVDYWGFQNGKTYGENYYIGLKLNNVNYPGVRKDPNFEKTIIGTLKKITYPTGGTAEFKFEQNNIGTPYFETHTYEPLGSSNSIIKDLPVYNHYSSSQYDQYPSTDVHTFQIPSPTTLKITCSLENTTGLMDPVYDYNGTAVPLGRLKKISPSTSTLYSYGCPFVFDSGTQAQGSEITLNDKEFTLDAGTYEFTAYKPPRDVLAYWRLYYQQVFTPQPGVPTGPYKAGGIRISEIKDDAKIRRFTYPAGNMTVEPVLYHTLKRLGVPETIYIDGAYCTQVSESKTPLSSFSNGNFVGYDWVEEYIMDEEDDVSTIRYNFYNDNESDFFDDRFPDSPRYIQYRNGLTKSIEKFGTKMTGPRTLIEKQEFDYTSTYSNLIKAFKDKGNPDPGSAESMTFGRKILQYHYIVEWPLKTKLTNTLKTDDGKSMVSETNYSYNSKDLLQSTSYSNDNIQITEKIKYPFDFNDAISNAMVSKNMIGMPIETITIKNNIVTQAKKTEYFNNLNLGLYLPKTISNAEFNTPVSEGAYSPYYKPVLNFDSYTANGKLIETKYPDGPSIYYVWGYNEQYPIAKLENFTAADAANIQSIITTAINASNADNSTAAENALRTALTNLRNAAPNAMVTTYTYDPLIGVTSITDPKSYTMYYQYDKFSRLIQVVDATGWILSKNEYNYKQ
jgi:YD repeat-containing protein